MPIRLEFITQPTDDDWRDLEKIAAEVGQSRLQSDSLASLLEDDHFLAGARFNARLVGVILCSRKNDIVLLKSAGVRSITQQRGVMHQTLTLLQQWARNEQTRLIIAKTPEAEQERLTAALTKRGFAYNSEESLEWNARDSMPT